ncbi:ABC transporter permease [Nocardioides marmoriginsengisoli]|uniref:ABC transporter permease n=1 Tax=Nocardioides marmoriginsengisoli TaxID=661483 RepID=A0A3N0CN21_9ACTN|nr:ABC transporter permease [Nocardioides marmoriginsengisoli]RNL64858.1 ABC transporter permease [Nocardioides marmoriginsengisoli]
MSAWTIIRLVAAREIRVKFTSRSYLLATGSMLAAVVLGGVLINVVDSSDPLKVGLTPQTSSVADAVTSLSGKGDVETKDVADEAAGKRQVRDGDLDALLTGTPDRLAVVVNKDLDPKLESVFTAIAQQQALSAQIEGLGGDPEKVASSLLSAVPKVTQLDPAETDGGKVVAAYIVGILIFLGLVTAGQLVAQGVVEEKTSRVVELLLATISPWQLMAGKVLGIGVVGLTQIAVVVAGGAGTASILGLVDTSELNLGATAISAIGWFLIGFTTYALALAGLAALVSRQEEVSSVISPVIMLMTLPYVVGVSIGTWEPDNPLVVWLSRIPFCSPLVMPIRIAGGGVPAWDVLLAVGLSLAIIPVLVWVAGRLYSNAVLQTGDRVKLLQAFRADRG